jgi:hypothetical protein
MCTQLGRHTLNLHDPWTQPTGSLCALSIGDVCSRLSVQVCLATWGRFFACRALNLDAEPGPRSFSNHGGAQGRTRSGFVL